MFAFGVLIMRTLELVRVDSKSVMVTWHPNVFLPMWKWVLVWSWWVRKVSRNEIQFIRVNSIICRILWKYIVLYFQYHRPIGLWNDLRIACRCLNTNFIKITWSNQVYRNQIYCKRDRHTFTKYDNLLQNKEFIHDIFSRKWNLGNILTRFSVVGLARFYE